MKYDYDFKVNCVEMYWKGCWVDTPEGCNQRYFRDMIAAWSKLAKLHGMDILKHPTTCTVYTPEDRYILVARVLAGNSQKSVAVEAGINNGQLSKWVKLYKIYGYKGLDLKIGRPYKELPMKKSDESGKLSPSEKEELIRLRAEAEYLRTENEAIKKSIALRREREAAQLKAKKQRSLKNFGKKDSN